MGTHPIFESDFDCLTVQNIMARGQQKIQSQQKNAERQAKMKKAKGSDQRKAAQAALKIICGVCRSQIGDPKTYRQHFEAKHPSNCLRESAFGVMLQGKTQWYPC